MIIGDRLKQLREDKNLSQGDMEKRMGLLRCYTSRVENGHTTPSVETLEKMARALEIPLYQLFYDGSKKPPVLKVAETHEGWGSEGQDSHMLRRFRRLLSRTKERDLKLLMLMAGKMAQRKRRKQT